jgi:peptidoglycan/LPS O-acetylase OafA/YrhL
MRKRIPQLDAVRGAAILIVIAHNTQGSYPDLHLGILSRDGWMGVDLFFVLSGFLITGILLQTRQSAQYFRNFYGRRCLRIWPLYYGVLFFMFVMVPLLRPSEGAEIFAPRASPWWAYPLFLQNFLVAVPTKATGPLGVTWSLAVEEQFYLVWPWLVRFLSHAQLRLFAVVVILASPVLRLFLSLHGLNIYSPTYCRLDGLMAGALLALLIETPGFDSAGLLRPAWACLLAAAPLALLMEALGARWITFTFDIIASACFIYLALFSEARWFRTLITNRFLVYTGVVSYGLYLLHKIPFDAARALHIGHYQAAHYQALVMVDGVAASYGLAALSWNLLEKPCLKLKRFFPSQTYMPVDPFTGPLVHDALSPELMRKQ